MRTREKPRGFRLQVIGGKSTISVGFTCGSFPSQDVILRMMRRACSGLKDRGARAAVISPLGSRMVVPISVPGFPKLTVKPKAFRVFKGSPVATYGTFPQKLAVEAQVVWAYDGAKAQASTWNSTLSWDHTRSGSDLPNYRKVILAGGNATTAFTAQRGELFLAPASMLTTWHRSSAPKVRNYNGYFGVLDPSSPTKFSDPGALATADNLARQKLIQKISALDQYAKIGETLGEMHQVIRMLRRPLSGLNSATKAYAAAVRNLSRGKPVSGARTVSATLQSASELWLSYRFGIMPLVRDVEGLIETYKQLYKKVTVQRISASFVTDTLISRTSQPSVVNSYCYYTLNEERKLSTMVKYIVGLRADAIANDDWYRAVGLAPHDFVPTVYALVPYSWLFDYFTGLGNYIQALCQDLSFVTWTCKVVRTTSTIERVGHLDPQKAKAVLGASQFEDSIGHAGSSISKLYHVSRSIPSLIIPTPTLKLPKSPVQLVNIAALFTVKSLQSPSILKR